MSKANTARAKKRAKVDPTTSSEKATAVRMRRADLRAVDAQAMRRQGKSVNEIMGALDVSRRTVYNLLNRTNESHPQQAILPR